MAKKRVHEIAKERGISSKEVIAVLQKAGLDVKASASSVDENDIAMAFNGGKAQPTERGDRGGPQASQRPGLARPGDARAPQGGQATQGGAPAGGQSQAPAGQGEGGAPGGGGPTGGGAPGGRAATPRSPRPGDPPPAPDPVAAAGAS